MQLDTAEFALFVGCIAVVQAGLSGRWRVRLLLTASLIFYAFSSLPCLALMLGLCVVNYRAASFLSRSPDERHRARVFWITVVVNLAALIAFKYASGLMSEALSRFGRTAPAGPAARLAVPRGLSYFTFQMLACVTDAYRRTWRLDCGFTGFTLFGLFFPQISSGPIPRAGRLLPQLLDSRGPTTDDRLAGLRLMAFGYLKKTMVANRLHQYVETVFADPAGTSTLPAFLACCLNVLELYADFSGYIDIAMGSARFLGIRLDPNFDRPFVSSSVTEFWRRWHMTLAFWLRDYLYSPLVIRVRNWGMAGVVFAMMITFAICGIWHGATWNFLLFGITQGLALSAEALTKSWRKKRLKQFPERLIEWAGRIYAVSFFVLTQVLFRAADLPQALRIYGRLIHLRFSFHLREVIPAPYFFALDCLAIGLWMVVAWRLNRVSSRGTPLFVLLCGLLILFLGHLGTARFIYANF